MAAWWHDLGYAPALRDTGCHQIDGARYLTARATRTRLCALVAHHSAATCEAEERGLLDELAVWPREESRGRRRALDGRHDHRPAGRGVDLRRAAGGDPDRYDADSIVGRAMLRAEPAIRAAIERTRQRMQDAYTI